MQPDRGGERTPLLGLDLLAELHLDRRVNGTAQRYARQHQAFERNQLLYESDYRYLCEWW